MTEMTRITKQRLAIRAAFTKANRPLGPEEVLALAQESGGSLSMATVYRNIGSLVEEGWLQPVDMPGMSSRYEIAGKPHHHYFYCRACGKVYDLKGCSLTGSMRMPSGFRAIRHEVIVHGSCAECI